VELEPLRDPADLEALLGCHERDALAAAAGSCRAADTMDVGLLIGRRVEVDHVGDVV
jgi:hypothetical protein